MKLNIYIKSCIILLVLANTLNAQSTYYQQPWDCNPEGCTDETACNYDVTASEEDDSCVYAQEDEDNPGFWLTCDGACQDDDANGICDFNQVGCTDVDACNQSIYDDGSVEKKYVIK